MAFLRATFPWLEPLGECPQDPIFHAEGDVLTHMGMVLTELAVLPAFRDLSEADRHIVFAGTLLHDIAKPECTKTEDGRVTSPGHAVKGVHKARRILTDDPAFGPFGTPFDVREQIVALVRWHGLPGNYLDKQEPQRVAITAAVTARMDLLAIVAEADHRGRIVVGGGDDTFTRIGLFPAFCEECGVWGGKREFASDHSRFVYFRTSNAHPTLDLFDESKCEVTILSGLPGSGKDTWLKDNAGDREVISLDQIRGELDVEPSDDQSAVVAAAYGRAKALLRKHEPFVWNATNVSRVLREKVIGLCAAYKARVRVVYCEPPIPLIRQRNGDRVKKVPVRVWERLFDRLDVPTETEAHVVEYYVGDIE
jgi:putative nucleotidyltransferase with HDIG domain